MDSKIDINSYNIEDYLRSLYELENGIIDSFTETGILIENTESLSSKTSSSISDYSTTDEDYNDDTSSSSKKHKQRNLFVKKKNKIPKVIHKIYRKCIENDFMYFHEFGGIVILDHKRFEEQLCFEKLGMKYKSFRRILNYYGFKHNREKSHSNKLVMVNPNFTLSSFYSIKWSLSMYKDIPFT